MKLTIFSLFCVAILVVAISPSSFCSPAQEEDDHDHELEEDSHDHEEDSHDHEATCAITEDILAHEFSELAKEQMLTGSDGEICYVPGHEEEDHHHDDDDEHDDHDEDSDHDNMDHHDDGSGSGSGAGEHHDEMDPECEQFYGFVTGLLLRLNVTTPCCLGNETSCHEEEEGTTGTSNRTPTAQAYGYGFLMVIFVSLASLLGLFILPCAKHPRFKKYYQYFLALLISLGASALFSDAVLHLIPEAFGLHDHGQEDDGHAHSEEEEGEELDVVWKACVIILGTYGFFLFEFVLHSWTTHSHSIPDSDDGSSTELVGTTYANNSEKQVEAGKQQPDSTNSDEGSDSTTSIDPTFPHGTCSGAGTTELQGSIVHPSASSCQRKGCEIPDGGKKQRLSKKVGGYFSSIKPLAWLIIFGDGVHNFADGLALGAAISQSLSLGISTMIAIVFHEIPHEIGDFFILLSAGMTWYVALIFNFISALTAIVGFFVGVAIGTNSESANSWILAIAAGVFLYVALVDLLPELIHSKEKGCSRVIMFLMINTGFAVSFLALLLLAVYEEDLNSLVRL